MSKTTEILSPVGNMDMLYAAVRSGADAVYLGAKDFSARRNAENFDKDELKTAVSYCRERNVRVYLTLNILIKNSEFSEAFLLAREAFNMGIDGIIVQDLGLADTIHRLIPELPLHASTQMSVHSPSALPILKKMGFCQVVAAREMSKSELQVFCKEAKKLGITVEVFVHGALCMSVSGQCLLSAFLGSRSGNRGLCAGPCRLPFKVPGGTGNDLSLKDLSLIKYIREMKDLGVGSFKIEGRMKRPEYVAAVTYACKKALDEKYDPDLSEMLKSVFSRSGFTDGYYKAALGKNMFGIRTKEDVTASETVFGTIHDIYRNERQSVPVNISGSFKRNLPMSVTVFDGINAVTAYGDVPADAVSKPSDKETVEKNLSKLGGSPYFAESITSDVDEGLYISSGQINALRRESIDKLSQKRISISRPLSNAVFELPVAPPDNRMPYTVCRFEKAEQIPRDLSGIKAFSLPLEEEPAEIQANGVILAVDIPRGIISEDLIEKRLHLFKEKGYTHAVCGNLAAVEIAKSSGLHPVAGMGLNIYNSASLSTVGKFGVEAAVLSAEITVKEAGFLSEVKKGITVYGNIPLMLFKNCPLKNGINCTECDKNGVITDRLGVDFPVRCRMGYSELLNSVPIWLDGGKADLKGLDFKVLYFTREDPVRTKEIIDAFRLNKPADVPHTGGLYFRGSI